MTPDQKDELLAKMAEALRGILPAVSQFSEAHGFATQVLNAYDAAMKPELEPGWYVVQWQEDGDLECGEFSCGNWYPDAQSELHRTIYAEVAKLPTVCARLWGAENYARAIRVSDGVSNRVDGPWAIGNAVIPQIPEIIGRAIMSTFEKESGDADA